jgi:hypothetical protein
MIKIRSACGGEELNGLPGRGHPAGRPEITAGPVPK